MSAEGNDQRSEGRAQKEVRCDQVGENNSNKIFSALPRHGTDLGQVTGTGQRKGCPVPGDLGSGTKWVQWVLAKDKFDS